MVSVQVAELQTQFLPTIRIHHQDLRDLLKEAAHRFQTEELAAHLHIVQEVKAKATTYTIPVRVLPMQAVILRMA